jgi:hypothetical protein
LEQNLSNTGHGLPILIALFRLIVPKLYSQVRKHRSTEHSVASFHSVYKIKYQKEEEMHAPSARHNFIAFCSYWLLVQEKANMDCMGLSEMNLRLSRQSSWPSWSLCETLPFAGTLS